MSHSRRDFLKASAALAAPPLLVGRAHAAGSAGPDAFVAHYESRGYEQLSSHNLIADYAFNGGLRYDETPAPETAGKVIRLQGCARVEDIARRGEPGVLPYFHILAYQNPAPAYPGESCADILDALTGVGGLDPSQLVVVSTERVEPLRPLLADRGIGADRIVTRPWREAFAAGDGSGYFKPPGHPHAPGFATASLHYPLGEPAPPEDLTYPVDGYLEIGEFSVPPVSPDGVTVEQGGIGVERAAMVGDGIIDTYEEALIALANALEDEANARDIPLPEGYHTFRTL